MEVRVQQDQSVSPSKVYDVYLFSDQLLWASCSSHRCKGLLQFGMLATPSFTVANGEVAHMYTSVACNGVQTALITSFVTGARVPCRCGRQLHSCRQRWWITVATGPEQEQEQGHHRHCQHAVPGPGGEERVACTAAERCGEQA